MQISPAGQYSFDFLAPPAGGRSHRFPPCAGFTILEALVATVVLVAGLLAVLSFLSSALQVAAEAQARTVATSLAESKLHTLQSYLQMTNSAAHDHSGGCDEPAVTGGVVFSRCWWVDDSRAVLPAEHTDSSCTEGGYGIETVCWVSVRVEVTWVDRQASPQSLVLTGMVNVLSPERSALELMAWATHTEQAALPPQWLAAGELMTGSPGADEGSSGELGGSPDTAVSDPSSTGGCPPWGDLDEGWPAGGEVEQGAC